MGNEGFNLRAQLAVLRRRWRTVAVCTVAVVAASLALSLSQSPVYRSSTTLEISPIGGTPSASGVLIQPSEIATQVQVLLSTPVAERVLETLDLESSSAELLDAVVVAREGDTRVVTVTAAQPTPQAARDLADAFATEYLTFRREQATAQSRAVQDALEAEASRIRQSLRTVQAQLATATGTRRSQLQAEQQSLLVQLTQVMSDQATAAVNSPDELSGGQVLVPANLPGAPAEPKPLRSALLGGVLGLILGVGLAFVRDHFDDAVRDDQRLREAVGQRPILGRIPTWPQARSGRLATVIDPSSAVSEAYRALGANVRFTLATAGGQTNAPGAAGSPSRTVTPEESGQARPPGRTLVVASPMQSEGKTSVASNVAVLAARFGLRVVLIDADLRNPQVASVFGLGRPPGLTDLLAGDGDLDDFLIEVEGIQVLPGGSLAPNPAELLASPAMSRLLSTIASRTDLVVMDTAPILRVADALELVSVADLVLLVVRHGQTRVRAIVDAVERIHQVGGRLSGAVYFDIPRAPSDVYGQVYGERLPTPGDQRPGAEASESEPDDSKNDSESAAKEPGGAPSASASGGGSETRLAPDQPSPTSGKSTTVKPSPSPVRKPDSDGGKTGRGVSPAGR